MRLFAPSGRSGIITAHSVVMMLVLASAAPALAQTHPSDAGSTDSSDQSNAVLQKKIEAMQGQVTSLNSEVAELRQDQTQPASNGAWQFNYANGFTVQDGQDFTLKVNGLLDARYTYVDADNHTSLTNTALGTAPVGDLSGFSLNTAQLALSGSVYQHVLFKVMGNFGSTSSFTAPTAGTFQLNEAWGAFSFSPELNIRAGSVIIPIIPLKTIANYGGSEFPDVSDVTVPFAPGYGLGADVYGFVDHQRFSYDLMLGNGSNSQNLVDSAVNGAGRDNRLSAYTREQYAGSGTVPEFNDDPDLQDHSHLAWILGAGFGYESQNSAASAFPGSQTATAIPGFSAASGPGYLAGKYALDGNLYRAAIDFRTKYQGWSTFTELLYQDVASEAGPIVPGSTRTEIGQLGYFVQSGYFLVPRHFEVAARFGELYTLSFPHHMDEYTLGLNYYFVGENMKVQLAETYVPQAAALTSGNGSLVNTEDWTTELQLQVKF
ncbi:MAG: hypothetical protein ABSB74_11455 [Tepidisphaeraceae bacterium]